MNTVMQRLEALEKNLQSDAMPTFDEWKIKWESTDKLTQALYLEAATDPEFFQILYYTDKEKKRGRIRNSYLIKGKYI